MKKEPALFVALVVAILNLGLHYLELDWLDSDMVEGLANAIVVMLGGLLVRQKVIPVATVNEAGLTAADVQKRAADPSITPVQG